MTINDIQAILDDAAALVLDGWIVGELAMTEDGRCVDPVDADAVCFCARGAIIRAARASHDHPYDAEWAAVEAAVLRAERSIGTSLMRFNDSHARDRFEVAALLYDTTGDARARVRHAGQLRAAAGGSGS